MSGNDVRDEAVFQHHDLVTQAQFALFHARELDLIGLGELAERDDGAIQIAMFDAEDLKPLLDFLDRQHRLAPSP